MLYYINSVTILDKKEKKVMVKKKMLKKKMLIYSLSTIFSFYQLTQGSGISRRIMQGLVQREGMQCM